MTQGSVWQDSWKILNFFFTNTRCRVWVWDNTTPHAITGWKRTLLTLRPFYRTGADTVCPPSFFSQVYLNFSSESRTTLSFCVVSFRKLFRVRIKRENIFGVNQSRDKTFVVGEDTTDSRRCGGLTSLVFTHTPHGKYEKGEFSHQIHDVDSECERGVTGLTSSSWVDWRTFRPVILEYVSILTLRVDFSRFLPMVPYWALKLT